MLIIGHRGARGLAPENTLAAFELALACKVDEIETDIRVSSDGMPVLAHDPQLHGISLRIADAPYRQLLKAQPNLLTLDQFLDFTNQRVGLYLEVKPNVPTGPIIAVAKQRIASGWQAQQLQFASYDYTVLRQLHAALPECQLIINESYSALRACYRANQLDTKRITLDHRMVFGSVVQFLAKRGYRLSTYTLDNVERARRWQQLGLYGCITDYPDRFSTALQP